MCSAKSLHSVTRKIGHRHGADSCTLFRPLTSLYNIFYISNHHLSTASVSLWLSLPHWHILAAFSIQTCLETRFLNSICLEPIYNHLSKSPNQLPHSSLKLKANVLTTSSHHAKQFSHQSFSGLLPSGSTACWDLNCASHHIDVWFYVIPIPIL